MKRFFTYFFSFAVIVLFACQQKGFVVKGTLENAPSLTVYFDNVDPLSRTNNVVAKGETTADGQFKISMEEAPSKGIYRIRAGAKSAYLILDGSESQVNIIGNLNNLSQFGYAVTGSEMSDIYAQKMSNYLAGKVKIEEMTKYVTTEADAMIAMLAGIQLFGALEFSDLHQTISQKLNDQYPGEAFTTSYKTYAEAIQKEYLRQQSLSKIKVGELAPDIEMPGPDGTIRRLSDLKGNVVLLDFWAAWCRPCRMENPKVVRVYDKYKNDGFTVFSVSLDGLRNQQIKRYPEDQLERQMRSQRDRWVAAIKQDNLKWDSHVSDLKHFDSEGAAIYGVSAIPQTFLIDRDGRIAAINPRQNLEEAVRQVLGKV